MKAATIPLKIDMDKFLISSREIALNLGLISLGSIIFAAGMNSVMVPHGFLTGGVLGVALLAHYLTPALGIGFLYFFMNIPLIILGWFNISRRFMLYSFFGMGFFSFAAAFIKPDVLKIQDPMLAALLSGIICGAGSGIILRSYGSAGGLDILGVYLNKKTGLRIGVIVSSANTLVLLAGVYFYDIQIALYSMVYLFTCGKVIDAILTGFNKRKSLMVVSDHADRIAECILNSKGRGVTFLRGEGAFSHQDKKVIFTITTLIELPKIKELILSEDPEAFIVVNDTLEVLGKRHGMGKVY